MSNPFKRASDDEAEGQSPLKKQKQIGTTGTPVELTVNYFKMNRSPQFNLCQYRVDFSPEIDGTFIRKKIINDSETKRFIGHQFLFDGTAMYMTNRVELPIEINTIYNNSPMKVSIRFTREVSSSQPEAFQLFNLILRDAMAGLELKTIRRDLFDPKAKIDIPSGQLELWPGYKTSIREYDGDVLLCAEIVHKFMRKETILDIARNLIRSGRSNWKEELEKQVVGSIVLTDYTNKTYQIDEINFDMSPMSTFSPRDREPMTYMAYYKSVYDITITDSQQFMLVSNPKDRDLRAGRNDPIYLIPELSRATGMTDEMRANFKLMQEISEHTRLNPANRVKALQKFNDRLLKTQKSMSVMTAWDMVVDNKLLKVSGRELPRETIRFGDNFQQEASEKGDWAIRKNTAMYQKVDIARWIVIYPRSLTNESENFLLTLKNACQEMNIVVKEPLKEVLQNDNQEAYIQKIREYGPKKPKMILIILPTNKADRYSAVKKLCSCELGIQSQVVIKRVLNHKNVFSIATKVGLQMSTKLGGIPWLIKMPMKKFMTVGFDVSINPANRSESIGAIVASMDFEEGEFFSTTVSYRDGNEMNSKLAENMRQAVAQFKEKSGVLPEKIFFYRDGVGEGQIQYVVQKEIEPLLVKLQQIYGSDNPKLAYIIVNKRINSRIMKQQGTLYSNPRPGTVVDQTITLPTQDDFYLISQHVGQGTVAPTYYNILYNSSGLNKDKLELLTFKLCHIYYNWSGTTRIPNVCQYAKKLAFLTSQSLRGQAPHENLKKSLFFL